MIELSESNFEKEVIEKSKVIPVLVDFWAQWCGPCRMLGPVLEKLEGSYTGRLILGKLNVDDNGNLAAKYSVMSIPNVKLFRDGKIVDEFVGALPESSIKAFLDKNV